MDVDYLYYLWKTTLNGKDEEFWNSTLRKINKMLDIYKEAHETPEQKKKKKENMLPIMD